jgi:hypothetical protein
MFGIVILLLSLAALIVVLYMYAQKDPLDDYEIKQMNLDAKKSILKMMNHINEGK